MGSQSRLSLVPATRTGRHHRYLTSTTACWLISRCIIIGHFPLRACPPQTGCTPAFPLGSLDAIFFTAWLAERTFCHDCCRSVTAPRLRLMKRLTYLNCWIWLAGCSVILCLLSEPDTKIPSPAFVKVRFAHLKSYLQASTREDFRKRPTVQEKFLS